MPPPDIVVEIDWTPIAPALAAQRLHVYAGVGVPEVWTWERDGDHGLARIHVLADTDYEAATRSAVADLAAVLNEADEERRMALTGDLACGIARQWRDQVFPVATAGARPG